MPIHTDPYWNEFNIDPSLGLWIPGELTKWNAISDWLKEIKTKDGSFFSQPDEGYFIVRESFSNVNNSQPLSILADQLDEVGENVLAAQIRSKISHWRNKTEPDRKPPDMNLAKELGKHLRDDGRF